MRRSRGTILLPSMGSSPPTLSQLNRFSNVLEEGQSGSSLGDRIHHRPVLGIPQWFAGPKTAPSKVCRLELCRVGTRPIDALSVVLKCFCSGPRETRPLTERAEHLPSFSAVDRNPGSGSRNYTGTIVSVTRTDIILRRCPRLPSGDRTHLGFEDPSSNLSRHICHLAAGMLRSSRLSSSRVPTS
jgi:hypothetical protein